MLAYACRTRYESVRTNFIYNDKPQIKKQDYNIIAYIAGWSSLPISKIDVKRITHVNYAFANLNAKAAVFFANNSDSLKIDTLQQLKKHNPELKLIVSVGGASWSEHFSEIAASERLSNSFADNIAEFVKQYKLDGIDIDWEFPCMRRQDNTVNRDDKKNFTSLLQKIRSALNALEIGQKRNDHYILTIAAGISPAYLRCVELHNIVQYVDFVNVMAYNYRSGADWETGHHSNLKTSSSDRLKDNNSIDVTISRYIEAGVSPEKVILGVPFYGRLWAGVRPNNNGLYQPAKTGGKSVTYRNIRKYYTLDTGYADMWDDSAKSPYLWNPNDSIFISYETPRSLAYKVDYIRQYKLKGIMFWEYNSDNNNELYNAILSRFDSIPDIDTNFVLQTKLIF
jgi:chitinase